jgi:HSP20 family protein
MNSQKEVVAARQKELATAAPAVDIEQYEEYYRVRAAVPGAVREDVGIQVIDDAIEIEVRADWDEAGSYSRREFAPVQYKRRFKLGNDIDRDAISASLNDGILNITLPRKESARPRQINVE